MTWEDAVLWLRAQPDRQDLVRACFYDDPLQDAADRYYATNEWRAVRACLPSARGRALDIGAGRGISSYALTRDGWQVTALEPDPSPVVGAGAIRSLNEACGIDIRIVESFGETLPFDDGSFDLVYCRATLHHAHDLPQLCREAHRVLAGNGKFVATREHVITKLSDKPAFLAGHPLHHLYGGENAFLLREYQSAIRDAGFRLERSLNPWESDINLFPMDQDQMRRQVAKRLSIPAVLVPRLALALRGALMNGPGRLYSFIAQKTSAS